MGNSFQRRIGYTGDIEHISRAVCDAYNLGTFKENDIITTGYEDFNISLRTTRGKYLIKIFSDFRDVDNCKRYVDVMSKVMDSKISIPRLLKLGDDYFHVTDIDGSKIRLCVMNFIEGRDFYMPERAPNEEEIKYIAKQAAMINSIMIKPTHIYDTWAVVNFSREFKSKNKYLQKDDLKLIAPVLADWRKLGIEKMPHCFVHGDMIKTNLIEDMKRKIWILDFAVSNYYPRIVEMAVLACNVLFNKDDKRKSERNLNTALKEYQKTIILSEKELAALPTCVKAAHAMHILISSYERKAKKNTTKENEYWFDQGRSGLLQML